MKNFYFILVLLIFVGFTSCSSGKSDEERAQDLAESILEKATGEKVDIQTEKDEDGQVTNMTIKTDEGELTISGNQKELPDDLPDFYIPKGEMSNISSMKAEDGSMVSFRVLSDKSVNDAKEEIKSNMADWTNSMDMSTPDGTMLTFDKEEVGQITMTIGEKEGKTEIAYIINYKTK